MFEKSQAVKEKRVRIHRSMTTLPAQLKAVSFNARGHPDKTKLNFDLGDTFLMGVNHLKSNRIQIISLNLNNSIDED